MPRMVDDEGGFPKGRASMSKTTRCKSNVDMRLGEEIEGSRAKLT